MRRVVRMRASGLHRPVFCVGPPGRKGQLSIVLIMVALLVISILVISYVESSRRAGSANQEQVARERLNDQFMRIDNIVWDCFDAVAWRGLMNLGKYGGYTGPQPFISNNESVTYWAFDQVNIQPDLEDARLALEDYIERSMDDCVGWNSLPEGFALERDPAQAMVFFNHDSVIINLSYPYTIRKDSFERSNSNYQLQYGIRLRRLWEMATQVNARIFDPTFRKSDPLAAVVPFDMNITYKIGNAKGARPGMPKSEREEIVFRIRDPRVVEKGSNGFTFQFAARFFPSGLSRTVDLPNATAQFKTVKPMNIFSTDKNALVAIPYDIYIYGPSLFEGWKQGEQSVFTQSPRAVRVSQMTGVSAVRSSVPMKKHKKEIKEVRDIVYNLDYPIYGYEPQGTTFSEPVPWVFYWDEDDAPGGPVAVLHYDGANWEPVVADANMDEGYVVTDIDGFSNYTVIKCQNQQPQTTTASTEQTKPPTTCIIIGVTIVLVVVIIVYAPAIITTTFFSGGQMTALGSGTALVGTTTAPAIMSVPMVGSFVVGTTTTVNIGAVAAAGVGAAGAAGAVATARAINIDPLTGERLPNVFPRVQSTGIAGITGFASDASISSATPTPVPSPSGSVSSSGSASSGSPAPFMRSTPQVEQYLSNPQTGISSFDSMTNYTVTRNETENESENPPREKKDKQTEQTAQEQEGCITFKPACDGTITVKKESDKAKGKCTMKSGTQVKGGQTYQICAQISSCSCFCGCTCTLSCEVTYT